jgi:parvulin-like peptidyl-prolyl isomerase
LGETFAKSAAALAPGSWSEPLASPYGLHLVWVSEHEDAALPPLDAIRPRVLRAYRAERRDQYLARMMTELRGAYAVQVEAAPEGDADEG